MAKHRRKKATKNRIKTGEPLSVLIESLSHDGRGIARVDGKATFVWGALPGERVRVQRIKGGRDFDLADVLEVEQPSPERVAPPCPVFGTCGGCSMQHLDAPRQIEYKQQVLAGNFRRIARLDTDKWPQRWLPPLTSESLNYRRRARLAVKFDAKQGRALVGFRQREGNALTRMERCDVLMPPMDGLITPLARLIERLSVNAQIPQVELAVGEGVTAVVFRVLQRHSEADEKLLKEFATEHSVDVYIQAGGHAKDSGGASPLTAARRLYFSIEKFGLKLDFQPTDFIQVNADINDRMLAQAIELLQLDGTERVLDLFCGLGNFTLPLATLAKEVIGVENDQGLIDRARKNADSNDLKNVRFYADDLFEMDSRSAWLGQKCDAVILDPPRTGAREVLPYLAKLGAKKVLYVSCHPGTLARDTGILVNELGYKLTAAGVMDMFPHTAHVESMVLFEKG